LVVTGVLAPKSKETAGFKLRSKRQLQEPTHNNIDGSIYLKSRLTGAVWMHATLTVSGAQ
jgi:hypothetical protein